MTIVVGIIITAWIAIVIFIEWMWRAEYKRLKRDATDNLDN